MSAKSSASSKKKRTKKKERNRQTASKRNKVSPAEVIGLEPADAASPAKVVPESKPSPKPAVEPPPVNLNDPSLYVNRELSWLEFNKRVLEEAQDPLTPSLEKLKFSSIFHSNLDEYFMVRVGGLFRELEAGVNDSDSSGMTIRRQLDEVAEKVRGLLADQYASFMDDVLPGLQKVDIFIHNIDELDKRQRKRLDKYFEEQVFPILTPLAVDAGHPFPFLTNLRLNLMVIFKETGDSKIPQAYAFVEVPSVLARLIGIDQDTRGYHFVLLEDLIKRHIHMLFPGMEVRTVIALRVTRNQDYDLHEEDVTDLLKSVEAEIKDRSDKLAVRLEVESGAPKKIVRLLAKQVEVEDRFVYEINGPINIRDFLSLYDLPVNGTHRDPPFNPRIPRRLAGESDIFTVIRDGDVLLHHPYDSFAVFMDFLNASADDPNVLAIKQTLYRIGKDSPVVAALRRAAENGKQVTAAVELKARFDEGSNIDWVRQMSQSGVNSVFGFVRWKIHCKATLVVRREGKQLRRYVHVSTGNYNTVTSRIYTDLGLFTCDPSFGNDVSSLFNVLTGFNSWSGGNTFTPETVASMFHKFMISPVTTQQTLLRLIDREIQKTTSNSPGRIIAKMNALVDTRMVGKLYEASRAGVRVDLLVRGICCLRPGIPGVSDNIRVISILDRFLEHSRIYYFDNGGNAEIYSGSADWMPRNFKRRAEILYPIEDVRLKTRIMDEIFATYLNDNVKARIMQPDGTYVRAKAKPGTKPVRSQSQLIAIAREGGIKSAPYEELVKEIGKKKAKKHQG
ncbi:MAG TPA: polyphosphate kinase 1 [Syntrophorhabdaceae bacterium]|nr:polyphosphate kinase 1 [Syntrophorhabdaceae bacterium]